MARYSMLLRRQVRSRLISLLAEPQEFAIIRKYDDLFIITNSNAGNSNK